MLTKRINDTELGFQVDTGAYRLIRIFKGMSHAFIAMGSTKPNQAYIQAILTREELEELFTAIAVIRQEIDNGTDN